MTHYVLSHLPLFGLSIGPHSKRAGLVPLVLASFPSGFLFIASDFVLCARPSTVDIRLFDRLPLGFDYACDRGRHYSRHPTCSSAKLRLAPSSLLPLRPAHGWWPLRRANGRFRRQSFSARLSRRSRMLQTATLASAFQQVRSFPAPPY